MTLTIVTRAMLRTGRHRLLEATQPLTTRADLVAQFKASDRRADRQTLAVFGGILLAGLITVAAPFVAYAAGWL